MKKKMNKTNFTKNIFAAICIGLLSLLLTACDNDNFTIVREYDSVGRWTYAGFAYDAITNFTPANDSIKKDLTRRNNKSNQFILDLSRDGKYIVSEQTVLQDSGRYELTTSGKIVFTSKMLNKPILSEEAAIYLNKNDLTLTYDVTSLYDKELLESLGLTNAAQINVYSVTYHYLFAR
jgi:ketosteroid isomerase-like protein